MIIAVGIVVALVVLFVFSLLAGRFRESPVPAGEWRPTEELFIDPGTGRRMRVWVDPQDGSRHYVPEGQNPGHV